MSIAVPLYGFGTGGGNSLYYSVVCQTAEPAKKEGRIWVKSAVEMTQFEVGNTWTTAKVGVVVVGGTPGGANPTSANKILDLINTKVAGIQNRLKLTPVSCNQVQGSVGNWVSVDAYVCHSNTWIQFSAARNTPEFTYTGDYEIVDDSDNPISDFPSWRDYWKIRFLTSGTLRFTSISGAIDVFLVGGGGGSSSTSANVSGSGGGGGGYTVTAAGIAVNVGTSYSIDIGSGGSSGIAGGASSAFGKTALGGNPGKATKNSAKGGDGGSGGGGGGEWQTTGGNGGSDGGDGISTAVGNAGAGQGTTTREFGEPSGKLYSGGGGGGSFEASGGTGGAGGGANGADRANGISAAANTGGGAGGTGVSNPHGYTGAKGGSGIVIIRNARGAA